MPMRPGRWRRDRHRLVPIETEVDEELAAHLEMQTLRFVEAGLSEPDARAAALRRFGDVAGVRDECRAIRTQLEDDMRRTELHQELRMDAAFALRTLRRSRLFTVVALLTIALGVGATTAIFGVVHAVLLSGLPYAHADRTLVLGNGIRPGEPPVAVSPPEYFDIAEQFGAADLLAAVQPRPWTIGGDGAEPERITGYLVSQGLFDLLGARPLLGRGFAPADGAADAPKVTVLSHALWMRRFGGDSGVVGRDVQVDGAPHTVVGVMPPAVRFPDAPVGYLRERADLWVPTSWEHMRGEERGWQFMVVLARLREDVTPLQARAGLDAIEARFRAAFPDRYAPADGPAWRIAARPLRDEMLGDARPTVLLLAATVGVVLLMACANVANLLLARGALRRREIAVRTALGAGRGRLVRQLLTESTILALAGGLLGVLLAVVATRALVALDAGDIPRLGEARVNAPVLLFAVGASLVTGLLVGLLPALQQSRAELREALGEGSRGATEGRARRRLRTGLVVAQVAMALVLLVAAGLLGRSFLALQRVEPGFDARGVLTFQVSTPRAVLDSAAHVRRFHVALQQRLAAIPGVTAASAAYPLPMSGEQWGRSYLPEHVPVTPDLQVPSGEYAVVLPGYFRALDIPLLQGREFDAGDTRESTPVVIVDEELARRHWPNESPIGRRLNPDGPPGYWATVVGVVRHVRRDGLDAAGSPQLYRPHTQHTERTLTVVLRTTGDPAALTSAARAAVQEVHAGLPIARVATMEALVSRATARQRFNALLLAGFAAAALALASVGLYGVMAYLVAQRTREIGVRLALGAAPAEMRRLVLREALLIAVAGLAIGAVLALALSRTVSGLLYGVSPTDAPTYGGIAALLLAVALAAAYGPARRATRVDPVVAMRGE